MADDPNEAAEQDITEPAADPDQGKEAPTDPAKADGGDESGKTLATGGEGAPEKYELEIPEDSPLGDNAIKEVEELARKHGFSNDQAKVLLEGIHGHALASKEAMAADLDESKAKWESDSRNDPEIGGEAFSENLAHAQRIINRFGSEKLKEALDTTGLGNHPELLRTFARIGKNMADDRLEDAGVKAPAGERPMEDAFYSEVDGDKEG